MHLTINEFQTFISVSNIGEKLDNDPTGRELRAFIGMGLKTMWISCLGEDAISDETVTKWNNIHKKHLQQVIKMLTHNVLTIV